MVTRISTDGQYRTRLVAGRSNARGGRGLGTRVPGRRAEMRARSVTSFPIASRRFLTEGMAGRLPGLAMGLPSWALGKLLGLSQPMRCEHWVCLSR